MQHIQPFLFLFVFVLKYLNILFNYFILISCPTIEIFAIMVENPFTKVCHSVYYIKIIIFKFSCVQEKVTQNKVRADNT